MYYKTLGEAEPSLEQAWCCLSLVPTLNTLPQLFQQLLKSAHWLERNSKGEASGDNQCFIVAEAGGPGLSVVQL